MAGVLYFPSFFLLDDLMFEMFKKISLASLKNFELFN
jgi:hypothetical protein